MDRFSKWPTEEICKTAERKEDKFFDKSPQFIRNPRENEMRQRGRHLYRPNTKNFVSLGI